LLTDRKYIIFMLFCIFLYIIERHKYNKYEQTVLSIHRGLFTDTYKGGGPPKVVLAIVPVKFLIDSKIL
jgi:hypothetical protein